MTTGPITRELRVGVSEAVFQAVQSDGRPVEEILREALFPDVPAEGQTPSMSMTRDQLAAAAVSRGVIVGDDDTKAVILQHIRAHDDVLASDTDIPPAPVSNTGDLDIPG